MDKLLCSPLMFEESDSTTLCQMEWFIKLRVPGPQLICKVINVLLGVPQGEVSNLFFTQEDLGCERTSLVGVFQVRECPSYLRIMRQLSRPEQRGTSVIEPVLECGCQFPKPFVQTARGIGEAG